MNIALSIVRWILAIGISAALSLWIFLATINATVANRDVVKNWLVKSGVYENVLTSDAFPIKAEGQSGTILTDQVLKEAFIKTFDATYLRESTNTVIDASYDWMEGAAPAIEFSIPVDAKSAEFNQHLIDLIMPKLLALPQCTGRIQTTDANQITCIPPGVEPIDYAEQLSRPSSNDRFLSEPITHDAFTQNTPRAEWLPAAVQWLHILLWALPLIAIVFSALYVLASPDKIRGIIHVARRLTIGATLSLIGGLFMWLAGASIDLAVNSAGQQATVAKAIVNPIARTFLPDVGMALVLYSSLVIAIAGTTWLGVAIWRHKRDSQPPTVSGPPVPPPPTNAPEAQLPPPLAKP